MASVRIPYMEAVSPYNTVMACSPGPGFLRLGWAGSGWVMGFKPDLDITNVEESDGN